MKKKEEHPQQKIAHVWGTYIERPRRSEIFVCTCGNKYLKTRKNQVVCLRCM